jgi:hypothetical protein
MQLFAGFITPYSLKPSPASHVVSQASHVPFEQVTSLWFAENTCFVVRAIRQA